MKTQKNDQKILNNIANDVDFKKGMKKLYHYSPEQFLEDARQYIKAIQERRMINNIGSVSNSGYETKSLNSEILASLLASQNARTEFQELENEITEFFDTLNEERDEETEEEEITL